ncbi:MAG: PEGA domain-containing protein, partial [Oligoflexia bacterium]|nr:PEGA domain-containing protein [Oligoflexia bacterium]
PAPDDPFGIADGTTKRPNRRGVAGAMDIPLIPGAAPLAGFGEEATLIRPSPQSQPDPGEWGDLETVIRPSPTALEQQQGEPVDQDSTRRIPRPGSNHWRPTHDAETVRISARNRPKRWPLHVAYVSLIALCSIIGLVAGVLLTQWRLGQDPADQPLAVPQHPPQLRVQLPDGATLRVDGRTAPGPSPVEVPLSAGVTHSIDIQLEGFNPISTRMKLQANDVRVLSIQTESLQAQQH